ncbi:MAG: UTP--glucose-1-phosphate uridylyltransferase [Clostridia bacterium]|nr:UTP--glucose-1-phosphate uridylyltransferase [Clostridia bacterium]
MEEILKKYNQKNILEIYNKLDEENKEKLKQELLKIDFEKIAKIYKEDLKIEKDATIEPIDNVFIRDNFSQDEKEELRKIGEDIFKSEQYAVITMAGGQGTRLGHKGPKGTYMLDLKTGQKSIFEVLIDNLKDVYKKYNVYIPWYIMTSKENNDETVMFFESNNYFEYGKENVHFFKQDELPMVGLDGNVILEAKDKIKLAANGNGGVFESIITNNILDELIKKGIEWVYISGVDNILANFVDEEFVGLLSKNNFKVGSKTVLKNYPDEKVGVFCKKNSKVEVVEYIELSEKLKNMRKDNGELLYSEANIVSNLFNIEFLNNLQNLQMPYHKAIKKCMALDVDGNICEVDAYKYELFIFDVFRLADKVGILRVNREDEFAPIKNKEGQDSSGTAIEMYNKKLK